MLNAMGQSLLTLAQGAAAPGGAGGGGMFAGQFIIPLMLVVMLFMWLSARSQQKKQKTEREDMLSSLKPKDKIETIGGIFGTIKEIKEQEIVIRIDDAKDISLKVSKTSIRRRLDGSKKEPEEKS